MKLEEASLNVEAHKKRVKSQYDKFVRPQVFSKGNMVLVYDQDNDEIGKGKFVPKWVGPLVVKTMLKMREYELVNCDGETLSDIRNGIYVKKYIA